MGDYLGLQKCGPGYDLSLTKGYWIVHNMSTAIFHTNSFNKFNHIMEENANKYFFLLPLKRKSNSHLYLWYLLTLWYFFMVSTGSSLLCLTVLC